MIELGILIFQMAFIDSTGSLDALGCKVFVVFTNSFAGGLPLALMITTTETSEVITEGLYIVQTLISEESFGGKGKSGPVLFLTDGSQAERLALSSVFPQTRMLLCQFHVLQSMWCYIWKNVSGLGQADRMQLFFMFKMLVHEREYTEFEKKVLAMLQNKIVVAYPGYKEHLMDVLSYKQNWASCYHQNIISWDLNTNYLCESDMRVSIKIYFVLKFS